MPCWKLVLGFVVLNSCLPAVAQQISEPIGSVASATRADSVKSSSFRVLAIGVSKYRELQPLEFTAADARQVFRAYEEVGRVGLDRLKLVVDDGGSDVALTAGLLSRQVDHFVQQCLPSDTMVLFFAGHGIQLESGFVLAASDFSERKGSEGSLSLESLRMALSRCAARSKIVVLDCCHSGAFAAAPSELTHPFRSIPGCVVIAASRPSETSLETKELGAGVFTHWLVQGLRGAANTRVDTVIDAAELFEYVSNSVQLSTDELQTPAIAFDQTTEIPRIIELQNPDKPSDDVGVIPFPLPPSPQTMSIVLDSIGRFPEANPRRTIGACHWVLKHADPNSAQAAQARDLIAKIDSLILTGKASLGDKEPDELETRH